ncbi:serine/threonine-protein kinase Nek9-like isoform X2 [Dreissena polymorpha]|uniref:serine/threonine-protein kinase Nek9-like isoform X2 n=1 Tax=Dreissena polymorpha TaxID=45954 RepID=UPI0022642155|nr:serine/threonine-protein kinase Nek9-like isoform X2 [Dreissena polymorpha]
MATEVNFDDGDSPSFNVECGQETSYIYVRNLGSGAFAEANLYRKIEDNSLVVWKEIKMARLSEKERRDACNEIEILFLLNHANIITYYNHFMDEDTLLIELEYANGGSLAQKISNQKEPFEEEVVKWYLFQLASALVHCHENGIIHRDVKCLNIFMTKTDLLKLGDFGISKVLEHSSQLAETIAGTPLYMSPELMKGEKYNNKTDIWAMGCVLTELLTLSRTFQGTNQLKLAYEIVLGEHIEVDANYSVEIRALVDQLLQKEPAKRPSAKEVIDGPVLKEREVFERRVYELNTSARRTRIQTSISVSEQTIVPVVKSQVTEVYQWGGGKVTPQCQDIFVKGRSPAYVSAGHSHFAVVTMEKEVYTWANLQGDGKIVGQLGHGNVASYKTPKKVEAFEGIGIIQAECGEDFTVFLTDEGQVFSCGSNFYGCLGCEDEEDELVSPVCVPTFARLAVQQLSCGDNHVVALSKDGDVYTWGRGEFGRLGQGSEDDCSIPNKVELQKKHMVRYVSAGAEGTFLLTHSGRVLAAGSNEHNKLGFNSLTSGIKKHKAKIYDIPCKLVFTLVRPLVRLHVVTIASGANHSAVIDVCGHLYTFGCNKFGQLGVGDFKVHSRICRVAHVLVNHRVEKVTCGDGFTVASTSDNYVYAWGNGDNGRLGFGHVETGVSSTKKAVSIPRPIFGALHIVPNLSARHWHTILIAEKVLNQKTLKSRCSLPGMKLPSVNLSGIQNDSAFSEVSTDQTGSDDTSLLLTEDSGNPISPEGSLPLTMNNNPTQEQPAGHSLAANTDTDLPPWLAAELEDEVIPIPLGFVIQSPGLDFPGVHANHGPVGFLRNTTKMPVLSVPKSQNSSPQVSGQFNSSSNSSSQSISSSSSSRSSIVTSSSSWSSSSGEASTSSKNCPSFITSQTNSVPGQTAKDQVSTANNSMSSSQEQKSLEQTIERKDLIINQLAAKVKDLEISNMKMRDHYEDVIKKLQSEIAALKPNATKKS